MSAVLLRRIYSSSVDFYDKLAPALQEEMKNDLLQAINTEQLPTIRKKICDAVAELSRSLLDEDGYNHWQELLKFLFECCNSSKSELKESALHIFVSFPGIFGTAGTLHAGDKTDVMAMSAGSSQSTGAFHGSSCISCLHN